MTDATASARSDTPRPTRDRPWVMRTYAGHSSAAASNALYRRNLDKGQTGLSVAFDLPTQTGYDPDEVLARGEVGKVGVPISHIGDMRALFDRHSARQDEHLDDDQCDRDVAARDVSGRRRGTGRGCRRRPLRRGAVRSPGRPRTTSSRSTSRGAPTCSVPAPPAAHHRHDRLHGCRDPQVEPDQHLQLPPPGGGATPVQEIAYAMCTAIAVLDAVRDSGQVAAGEVRRGRRADLLLRQRRGALRRGDVQDARLRRDSGTS
jgi:(2R)-ethylmalonyl-CoA mutase